MRAHRRGGAAAVVLAAWLAVVPAPLAAQSDRPGGALQGRVSTEATGEPIAGALVRLEGTPLFRFTDATGRFRFTDLDEGTYLLSVSAPGFRDSGRLSVTVGGSVGRQPLEVVLREESFDLPPLVVTASRGAERFGETVASVDVLTGADIERRSAITLDEALRFASGVIFNSTQMDIRGASGLARGVGSRVLMMVDGHRFLSGTTGGVSFEAVPIMGIERVEVVKGPSSTLYGSNALGGVVNVIRKPIPERPETVVRAHAGVFDSPDEFDFTSETLGYQGIDLRHARRVGRLGVFAEGGLANSDGFRQNGSFERVFAHAGVSLPREEGPPLAEAFGLWSLEDKREFFQWASEDRPLEVVPEELGDWLGDDEMHVGLTVTPVARQDLLVTLRGGVYRAEVQNHFHDNEDYHRSTRYSLDAQASLHQVEGHVVTLGFEGALTPVEANILGRPRLYDLAAFAQDELRLTSTLRGTAGLRLDFHDTDRSASQFTLNPKLGVVFRPSERLSYRASVSRGYRAPSAVEQFVSTTQFGFRVIPNPDLEGETAWAFELGATGRLTDWIYADAGLFQTRFAGLIEPAPQPGGEFGTFQFQNVAEARVRGADASVRFGLVDDLVGARLTYVFLDTEDLRSGQALPYRSRHNLTVSGDVGPLGVDVRHRSRVERVLAFPLDPREAITVVGLRLGFRFGGVMGRLELDNLFQATYVDVQERLLGPSRSFQLTVQSTF